MLASCLDSLACQMMDGDHYISIVVVDNEEAPNNQRAVAAFAAICLFPVYYVHEPRRGIAFARNAVLHKSLATGADWIAFIDDDETAEMDWIAALMADEYRTIPVLMGRRIMVYPDEVSFWAPELRTKRHFEGQRTKTAYTHNVRFSIELVRDGLRFNERLGLMGGEDQEFFTEAHRRGFEIRRTLLAITHETAHPKRLTFAGQCYQAYWCAASDMRRDMVLKGWPIAIARKMHTVLTNVVLGLAEIAVSPAFFIAGKACYKRRALAGGKRLAKGAGRFAWIIGTLPRPYNHIVGG